MEITGVLFLMNVNYNSIGSLASCICVGASKHVGTSISTQATIDSSGVDTVVSVESVA